LGKNKLVSSASKMVLNHLYGWSNLFVWIENKVGEIIKPLRAPNVISKGLEYSYWQWCVDRWWCI